VVVPICILCAGGVLPWPILDLLADYWWQLLAGVLIINAATATWVSITREGVRVRRPLLPNGHVRCAPLGGEFSGGDSDPEDSAWDIVDRWNSYDINADTSLVFPTLRPVATSIWLNTQLHRIQAQQIPTARVVERQPDPPTGSPADRG
jgi:hypothetical protein